MAHLLTDDAAGEVSDPVPLVAEEHLPRPLLLVHELAPALARVVQGVGEVEHVDGRVHARGNVQQPGSLRNGRVDAVGPLQGFFKVTTSKSIKQPLMLTSANWHVSLHVGLVQNERGLLIDPVLFVVAPHLYDSWEELGGGPSGNVEAPAPAALVLHLGIVVLLHCQVQRPSQGGLWQLPAGLVSVAAVDVVETELLLLGGGRVRNAELHGGADKVEFNQQTVASVPGVVRGRRSSLCDKNNEKGKFTITHLRHPIYTIH